MLRSIGNCVWRERMMSPLWRRSFLFPFAHSRLPTILLHRWKRRWARFSALTANLFETARTMWLSEMEQLLAAAAGAGGVHFTEAIAAERAKMDCWIRSRMLHGSARFSFILPGRDEASGPV